MRFGGYLFCLLGIGCGDYDTVVLIGRFVILIYAVGLTYLCLIAIRPYVWIWWVWRVMIWWFAWFACLYVGLVIAVGSFVVGCAVVLIAVNSVGL